MKSLLIRLDEDLYSKIKKQARLKSTSMNKFILSIIETDFGILKKNKKPKKYTDLNNLSGKWAEKDYNLISKNIDRQRKIDSELWK